MLTRQQIRQFLAVVETGSFTRAADAIGVTQPSLSSGIIELEKHLGAQVFNRQRPSIQLTAAGNRLLPIARRIDRDFYRAEIPTRELTPRDRPFVFGVIPSFSTAMLGAIFSGLHGRQFTIREKDADTLLRELRRSDVDLAVIPTSFGKEEGLHFIPVYSETYRIMFATTHPMASREQVGAEELANEVMIARRSCELLRRTSDFFTSRGVRPRFFYKSENDDRAIALVAAGQGLTVAPQTLKVDDVASLELVDFNADREIAIVCRNDDYRTNTRYREMIELVAAELHTIAKQTPGARV